MNNKIINGTWIYFELIEEKPKTQVWKVMTKEHCFLGIIKWLPSWRKYAFFPEEQTIYENICLNEIANFIGRLMDERKMRKL